jgi:uncharacterized protein
LSLTLVITLFLAAALGGALNAVVGGATFVIFPALVFAGVPPIQANATSSVVVWPGAVAGVFAYREDINLNRKLLLALGTAGFMGGAVGAWLLVHTPGAAFIHLVPWLLLFASLLFTFGGTISGRLLGGTRAGAAGKAALGVTLTQFLISIYGGYFGAGMGILMLAAYAVVNLGNIHTMNGVRSVLGVLINGVAIGLFIYNKEIVWKPALVMIVGSTVAGYFGAVIARRIDPAKVKRLVMAVAWAMTAYFFFRAYHGA